MNLADATDEDLLKAGLTSLDELKRDGQVLNPMKCWTFDGMQHELSAPRMCDEGWYRACVQCGYVEQTTKPVVL
ncbi:hypothetical protein EVB91_182 [Rhizobium phage RHph_I1_18]|nr:hypothetical protein EVB91_182 [Rhizobium phage RHph_I1_18]